MSIQQDWEAYLQTFRGISQSEKEQKMAAMSPEQRKHLLTLLAAEELPPVPTFHGDDGFKGLPYELRQQLMEHRATAKALRDVLGSEQAVEIDDVIKRLEDLKVHLAVFGAGTGI